MSSCRQTPEELAGPHYEEMMRSKESALQYLSSPDYRVRIAAMLVCQSTWNCGADSRVVEACRSIAASEAEDSFRITAISLLGMALSATKNIEASRFVANLVMASANSVEVRRTAYWGLREIQFGIADVDFDTFLKGTICTIKSVLREYPGRFSEDDVRHTVTPQPGFPEDFWDSADEIDWEFVRQFT